MRSTHNRSSVLFGLTKTSLLSILVAGDVLSSVVQHIITTFFALKEERQLTTIITFS
jgi:hypothetical protein